MLDNPVWSSLITLHRGLARGESEARRYPADVAPFLAVEHGGAEPGEIVEPGETVFAIGPRPAVPAGWRLDDLGTILQMVCAAPPALPPGPPIVELDGAHLEAVRGLAALVYPHFFRPRTTELGRYFGIYDGPMLAAMAGERMGMPGFREISAVCTHPAHVGRGLARRLLAFLTAGIAGRGDTAFLHVSPGNTRAIELYEWSGYRTRIAIAFAGLTR